MEAVNIDHIFIFTSDGGKIADELINLGFSEGSHRIHIGQGTSNRKFYFENFFLEVLWVHNEIEISAQIFKEIGLFDRSIFFQNGHSPFGLCLVNSASSDCVFNQPLIYQPAYFPKGMPIEIIKNITLPWTFRLPFRDAKKNTIEPLEHPNSAKWLTNAKFEYKGEANSFTKLFEHESQITFELSTRNWLTLTFDEGQKGNTFEIKNLQLTILI